MSLRNSLGAYSLFLFLMPTDFFYHRYNDVSYNEKHLELKRLRVIIEQIIRTNDWQNFIHKWIKIIYTFNESIKQQWRSIIEYTSIGVLWATLILPTVEEWIDRIRCL